MKVKQNRRLGPWEESRQLIE
ncbi:uncharacterized protein CPUR_04098 [Claviceps purpurea 20.1]|uniref:Uncharacterized protein n=1 Tax=Claviceps purpurea (strain 20.1) TaxID=1111077 RepID=M1W609_CLAP2|nr:uncharacterized protein CPUR_04098 [Claviceps purpurea 20.1]